MTRKQICVVGLLLVLIVLIFSLNFYFLNRLNDQVDRKLKTNANVESEIKRSVKRLSPIYLNKNPRFYVQRNKLLNNFKPSSYDNVSLIWDISYWWPKNNEIYPARDSMMGKLIYALQNEEFLSARNSVKGTQLKLLLKLAGNQKVIFKPKWYENDVVITGPVYAGKDRHTAEIFGFYLGAILNFRWTPIAVGKKLNLKEVFSKADKDLRQTMIKNETNYCVYGKCFYCKDTESVCGDENNIVEGVLLQLIPGTLSKYRSPWQRTYKDAVKAEWEENVDYCDNVKLKTPQIRLLDLIDVSIFDFLIQNGDRHHYETRNDRVILIDNGKGFGNPNVDFLDILAPLYQCCIIRKTTYEQILFYSGGTLSEILDQLLKYDKLYPILTKNHFKAIERRLLLVYSAVEYCKQKYGIEIFK